MTEQIYSIEQFKRLLKDPVLIDNHKLFQSLLSYSNDELEEIKEPLRYSYVHHLLAKLHLLMKHDLLSYVNYNEHTFNFEGELDGDYYVSNERIRWGKAPKTLECVLNTLLKVLQEYYNHPKVKKVLTKSYLENISGLCKRDSVTLHNALSQDKTQLLIILNYLLS